MFVTRLFNLTGRFLGRFLKYPTQLTQVAPPPDQQLKDPSGIRIKNFGQMDDRLYRGACPKEDDFRALAALGINTVVDLRKKADPLERGYVEELGMQYINIPMSDTEYPRSEHINTFLNLIKDPTAGKIFIHCAGGRHRTGVIGAVYRFTVNSWSYDEVYVEMKSYDFYTRWGHRPLKTFVQDFARQPNISSPTAGAKLTCHQNRPEPQ
jgi:protein tyrosine phosphatase (PTP) superfamily phosphohydrolase (DUF442 family)